MDCNGKDAKTKPLISSFKPQVEEVNDDESQRLLLLKEDDDENEDDESQSLLPDRNTRRKVQWNDINGNKLAEILEFQLSDISDSDDDESDSCFCTIM